MRGDARGATPALGGRRDNRISRRFAAARGSRSIKFKIEPDAFVVGK